jgi:threonine dehydrogenase-like Zn-dependent dehydrogenase
MVPAMKAIAVKPGTRKVALVDHPEPKLEHASHVKLKILEVGVCGTDKEICMFEYGTPPDGSDYLVIGHESLAEVVELGSGVTRVKKGDLAVLMVRRPCVDPTCAACKHGRQDFCFSGNFTERGIGKAHGYMTEFVVEHEQFVFVLPKELRKVGVLVEPLTIAEKALIQVWDVQERLPWAAAGGERGRGAGHKAVVLGAGPVGLLGAMALVVRGFETWVYSLEAKTDPKATLVEEFGGHYVSASDTKMEDLSEVIGNIDLVYEATGAAGPAFKLMEELGTNGVFILTGVPGKRGPVPIQTDVLMRNLVLRNQILYGTVNAGPDAFAAAVTDLQEFMKRWPTTVPKLISERYAPERFEELLLGKPTGIKNVISFGT